MSIDPYSWYVVSGGALKAVLEVIARFTDAVRAAGEGDT